MEDARLLRAEVVIGGRVQGVWFRSATRETAQALGLAGYVRNLPDGRVQAVFEGAGRSVRSMVTWCHKGPRMAEVAGVEVAWLPPTGEFTGFSVRY